MTSIKSQGGQIFKSFSYLQPPTVLTKIPKYLIYSLSLLRDDGSPMTLNMPNMRENNGVGVNGIGYKKAYISVNATSDHSL